MSNIYVAVYYKVKCIFFRTSFPSIFTHLPLLMFRVCILIGVLMRKFPELSPWTRGKNELILQSLEDFRIVVMQNERLFKNRTATAQFVLTKVSQQFCYPHITSSHV